MPTCIRCRKNISLLGALTFNQQTGHCGACEREVQNIAKDFRNQLRYTQAAFSPEQMTRMKQLAANTIIRSEPLAAIIGTEVDDYLDRLLYGRFGPFDGDVLSYISGVRELFGITERNSHLSSRLALFYKDYPSILAGILPTTSSPVVLDLGEQCHYSNLFAAFVREIRQSNTHLNGDLLLTSKRLIFRSKTNGSHEIPWRKVSRAGVGDVRLFIWIAGKTVSWEPPKETVRKYFVQEPLLVAKIAEILVLNAREG